MLNNTYVTKSGDTWDYVAHKIYGHSKYVKELMACNKRHVEIIVFSSGIKLNIPEVDTTHNKSTNLPPWRR